MDWAHFPPRQEGPKRSAACAGPDAPVVAAFLVKLDKGLSSMAKLRQELVEQPALAWALGFPLSPSPDFSYGFDVERSLPTHRHFSRLLRNLPQAQLQFLLQGTVHLFQEALPPEVAFGDEICGDTKHIIAWVRENNPKPKSSAAASTKSANPKATKTVKSASRPTPINRARRRRSTAEQTGERRRPPAKGCRLPAPLPKPKDGEYDWGYASGIVVTKVDDWGEVVLAELTQTFDHADESYFLPLMAQTERHLGRKPRFGAWDAASTPSMCTSTSRWPVALPPSPGLPVRIRRKSSRPMAYPSAPLACPCR
ncbi:MAG: hypothetical protein R3E79_59495 [Caldilineaceae bacterium]